jgi:regulator of extracellular matrix RemA (YlzA/DUF370 family)
VLISIGYNKFVKSNAIVEIIGRESARVKRLTDAAAQSGMLINATGGRRAGSVILLKSNHVVLSALRPEIIKSRLKETLYPTE